MSYSKSTELALKANRVYSSLDSPWHCYYHYLSGDDLSTQIITIAYKPTDAMWSFTYKELGSIYKEKDDFGLVDLITKKYQTKDDELYECINCIKEFLNDAKIEYTGRPFFNKEVSNEIHISMQK